MNENVLNLIIKAQNLAGGVLKSIGNDLTSLQNKAQGLAKNGFESMGNSFNKTADILKTGTLLVGGLGLAIAGLGFNSAVQIQNQMADVQKASGLTGGEVGGLRDKILDLSTTTATKTFDLIGIAKIGGALGVVKTDILDFTAAIDKVSVALGDEFSGGAEEVSTKLGTLRNLFKDTSGLPYGESMLKIGSSINSLGASGTATGPVVADFTSRIGQLGPALAPTITQALGLGAAFQELGLSSEISAGGLSNILLTAGRHSEVFAKQLGITTSAFSALMKKSPNEMILRLAESFKDIADDPVKLAQKMTELKIGSQESTKVMALLATKTDLVREKQKLASEEFTKGTSILEEYNIKNNTMSAHFGKAENMFVKFSSSLWNANLGAIGDQFQRLLIGVQPLIDLFGKGDYKELLSEAFGWEEDSVVIDKLLNFRGFVIQTFENIKNTLSLAGQKFNELVVFLQPLIDKFNEFNTNGQIVNSLFVGLSSTIGVLLVGAFGSLLLSMLPFALAVLPFVALGLAIAGITLAFQNQSPILEFLFGIWTQLSTFLSGVFTPELQTFQSIWQNLTKIFESVVFYIQPLIAILYLLGTQALQTVFYAIEQLRQPLNDFIQAVMNAARPIVDILAPAFVFIVGIITAILIPTFQILWAFVVQAFKGILEIITGVINMIGGVLNIFVGLVRGIFTGDFSQLMQGFKQLWEGLGQFLSGIITFLLSPIRAFIDGIVNIFAGFNLAQTGIDLMTGLANGMSSMVNIALRPLNDLKNSILNVLGLQSQAHAGGSGASTPVSGKGGSWAKGGAFEGGNVVKFATGGIVSSPTNFGMSGGRTGLMGEAGPEAIMPLTRGSDGKLGVKASGGGQAPNITNIFNIGTFLGTELDRLELVRMLEDSLRKTLKLPA